MLVFWIFRMFISFFVVHLSLYLYRASFGCRADAVRARLGLGLNCPELAL
jgi:hypothetical protein